MKKMKVWFAGALLSGLLLSLTGSVAFSQGNPDQYYQDLANLQAKKKENMVNIPAHTGVDSYTYEKAAPKEDFSTFYRHLCRSLTYPQILTAWGVEGKITLKFVVETDGQIGSVQVSDDFESISKKHLEELTEEAKSALLATSGDWNPARVNGDPVSSWVSLPIAYKTEESQPALSTPCSK